MLNVPIERNHVSGAGFREELFHAKGRTQDAAKRLIYIGKLSSAKGLPWLLDAFERLVSKDPPLELHIAGSGAGKESIALEQRMQALHPKVKMHGHLAQPALSDLMRQCSVCVLPSFYEGVPLVVTYHPSYLLRSPEMKRAAWADLQLALRVMGREPPPRRQVGPA